MNAKIIKALPEASGTSKAGKAWRKREYVCETIDRYPRTICFAVMNDNLDRFALREGGIYDIEIDVESREYEGRWYHSVTCWKANPV